MSVPRAYETSANAIPPARGIAPVLSGSRCAAPVARQTFPAFRT
jgi:hypothetical protein